MTTATPLLLVLLATASCRAAPAPDPLLGSWQNGRDRIEFLADGELRFHVGDSTRAGRYAVLGPAEIRVDLDEVWLSGEPRYWLAMPRGDQLGLCEIRNGRHCMRFARPGRRVTVAPR